MKDSLHSRPFDKQKADILQLQNLALTKEKGYICSIMAVSKTKTKLVDVARQLFAKNGVENTTMNDIAIASKKGRRTLYTYFKNKQEIYFAVIEAELERLSAKMHEVVQLELAPEVKIIELIYAHLDLIKEAVLRNGNLRAAFFRDIWTVEKVRKKFDQAEIQLFSDILQDGVTRNTLDIDNIPLVADILHYCVKGLEVPYIYGRLDHDQNKGNNRPQVQALVYRALGKQ